MEMALAIVGVLAIAALVISIGFVFGFCSSLVVDYRLRKVGAARGEAERFGLSS